MLSLWVNFENRRRIVGCVTNIALFKNSPRLMKLVSNMSKNTVAVKRS